MNQAILNLQPKNATYVNNQSNANYHVGKQKIYNTVLKSTLCD